MQGVAAGQGRGGRSIPGRGLQTLPHLLRGAPGEGHGQQLRGRHVMGQQILQAAHQHARLARAGPGQHQHGRARLQPGGQGLGLRRGKAAQRAPVGRGGLGLAFGRRGAVLLAAHPDGRHGGGGLLLRGLRGGFRHLSGPSALAGRGTVQQAAAAGRALPFRGFLGAEDAHHAVFAVIAALADDLAPAHAGHGLAQRLPVAAHLLLVHAAEDVQIGPQLAQQGRVPVLHLARAAAHAQDLAHQFGQGDQGPGLRLMGQAGGGFSVGQLADAVQHADGQGLAADRADIVQGQGLARFQHHAAGPVAVQMVFALFGIEFHGAQEAAVLRLLFGRQAAGRGPQGGEDAVIGGRARKEVGFAAQVGPGMRIGIGDERVAVQPADHAVHAGVRGKARLQREDVGGKVVEAVLQPVETGLGAEQGEPRRPDMGRDEHGLGADIQRHLQQVAGVQAQDGTAVGVQVAHQLQPLREAVGIVQRGHEDQVVDFAHLALTLVDGADLGLEQEERPVGVRRCLPLQEVQILGRAGQAVQAAGLVAHQLLAQLVPPLRVGEVAGAQHVDALAAGPGRQMPGRELFAGGTGKAGMDVQVGDESHGQAPRCQDEETDIVMESRSQGKGGALLRPGPSPAGRAACGLPSGDEDTSGRLPAATPGRCPS